MSVNRRFSEQTKVYFRDHDPDASDTLTNVGLSTAWVDMLGWNHITAIIFRTVGTGKVQDAALYVSAAAAGSSAKLIGSKAGSTNASGSLVDATAGKTARTGIGMVVLEANWSELGAALKNGRYVSARASLATGTDEMGVIYILSEPREVKADQLKTVNA